MFIDETPARDPWSVGSTPSLACDLSWLLSVAARPTMRTRYPQLAEMFTGREDLADSVRGFWGDVFGGDLLHGDAGSRPPRRRLG